MIVDYNLTDSEYWDLVTEQFGGDVITGYISTTAYYVLVNGSDDLDDSDDIDYEGLLEETKGYIVDVKETEEGPDGSFGNPRKLLDSDTNLASDCIACALIPEL